MIYYNIDTDYLHQHLLGPGETAWLTISAAIEESQQGFPDTTFIEGMWLQSKHCLPHSSQFDHENSRALVSLGTMRGREDCVEVDAENAITMFYRNQRCRNGRIEYEEFSPHTPPTWEPKCLVVLIEPDSRAALRDSLVEQGRILVHPLRIVVNYTTATSDNPDLPVASSNCALGRELLNLHEYEMVGQEQRDRLVQMQNDLIQARQQYELFNRIYLGLSAFRPPTSPPPPSSPPAPDNAPPAGPMQVSLGERNDQLRVRVETLEVSVIEAAEDIEICVPSTTNICGRSSQRAPNPWVAADGQHCAGYGTWEALEGSYCGYWGSDVRSLFRTLALMPTYTCTLLRPADDSLRPKRAHRLTPMQQTLQPRPSSSARTARPTAFLTTASCSSAQSRPTAQCVPASTSCRSGCAPIVHTARPVCSAS